MIHLNSKINMLSLKLFRIWKKNGKKHELLAKRTFSDSFAPNVRVLFRLCVNDSRFHEVRRGWLWLEKRSPFKNYGESTYPLFLGGYLRVGVWLTSHDKKGIPFGGLKPCNPEFSHRNLAWKIPASCLKIPTELDCNVVTHRRNLRSLEKLET